MLFKRNFLVYLIPQLLLLSGFAWQLMLLLAANKGTFTFVLDDPYIHLALAENIAKGHYGVNLQEFSAPSSSILWPFLLAPFAAWSVTPLILNLAAAMFGVAAVSYFCIVRLSFLSLIAVSILQFLLLVLGNWLGLIFTGLENAWQVALSLCAIVSLLTSSALWVPCVAAALLPLIRYEGSLVSLLVVGWLLLTHRYRVAVLLMALILGPLLLFSFYLQGLDLGWLPSSITAKSALSTSNLFVGFATTLYHNLYELEGTILALLTLPLIWVIFDNKRDLMSRYLALAWCGVVIGHLMGARVGNWGRYEIYLLLPLLLLLLATYRDAWAKLYLQTPWAVMALSFAFMMIVGKRYLVTSSMNAVGANNIYEQQYQMHRFVTEFYRAPVAVNDLGWVSYQNDAYVLDLWGLASREAQLARANARSPQWMAQLTENHQVGLAMIYVDAEWFQTIPANWQIIGTLNLSEDKRRMTSNKRQVSFIATEKSALTSIHSALDAFIPTLPAGVTFQFHKQ